MSEPARLSHCLAMFTRESSSNLFHEGIPSVYWRGDNQTVPDQGCKVNLLGVIPLIASSSLVQNDAAGFISGHYSFKKVISNILVLLQKSSHTVLRFSLWSSVNILGSRQAQTFSYCNCFSVLHALGVTILSLLHVHRIVHSLHIVRSLCSVRFAPARKIRILVCPLSPDDLVAHRVTVLRSTTTSPYIFFLTSSECLLLSRSHNTGTLEEHIVFDEHQV